MFVFFLLFTSVNCFKYTCYTYRGMIVNKETKQINSIEITRYLLDYKLFNIAETERGMYYFRKSQEFVSAIQNHVEVGVTPPATSSTNNTGYPEPA